MPDDCVIHGSTFSTSAGICEPKRKTLHNSVLITVNNGIDNHSIQ